MIIPTSNKKIKIGDIVTTIKKIKRNYFTIFYGHDFVVKDLNDSYRRCTLKDLETDLIIDDVYMDDVTLKMTLEDASDIYNYDQEVLDYTRYIGSSCPHTREGYSDRDEYTYCDNKDLNYYGCVASLKCAKYLKDDDVKKCKSLVKHLRKEKINNLKTK